MPPSPKTIQRMILDPDVPMELRRQLIQQACNDDSPLGKQLVAAVLEAASGANTEAQYLEKKQEVTDLLRALEEGPLRHDLRLHFRRRGVPWWCHCAGDNDLL